MKKLTPYQKHKVAKFNKCNKMDGFESYVEKKAREKFKRPPYGGRKV